MDDLAARLTEALDRAGRMAAAAPGLDVDLPTSVMPWQPRTILRLIERDRALLADHATAEAAYDDPTTQLADTIRIARLHRRKTLRDEVGRAAAFWLPEETTG